MQAFRLQGKHLALTYAQCPLEPQRVIDELKQRFGDECGIVVGRERHADGNFHLHVYLYRKQKFNIRNADAFDIDGHHPNIKRGYDPKGWVEYVSKWGDVTQHNFDASTVDPWAYAANPETSAAEAERAIRTHAPRDFILHQSSVQDFINAKRPARNYGIRSLESFTLSGEQSAVLNTWAAQRGRGERCHLLIICGPPGTGKTCLARCLGPHWYFRNGLNREQFATAGAEYTVIDDTQWDAATAFAHRSLLLGDQEMTVRCKYFEKPIVFQGIPCVWVCNKMPEWAVDDVWEGFIDFFDAPRPLF